MKKVELTAYQLKDVAHVWYKQWMDEWPLIEDGLLGEISRQLSLIAYFP